MTPEDILSHPPLVLTDAQRQFYFTNGFLAVDGLISEDWVRRLTARSDAFLEKSRSVTQSDEAFDLGPEHSPEHPHVRRLRATVDRHPEFWQFASASVFADAAADLVGPDVKFHSAKLNYKWPGAGEIVQWHQDILAWPHTNYSPVTLGVCLHAVGPAHGPLMCVPGSHEGPLFAHADADGTWTGAISDGDLATVDLESAVELTGSPGTLIAINCRTIHGSRANRSTEGRPLLLCVYSSADAFAWMTPPTPTRKTGAIVRGKPARVAHLDPRPCPVPPNWVEQGYGSIFTAQQGE
jgi:ectoine hydroxylase-related dioxygenase (phytanoyl-CoA dioxygenase family)